MTLVTVMGAVESFFNWRSRWVLMEESQYRFQRLTDDLEYLVALTAAGDLTYGHLGSIFRRYQAIWNDLSRTWLEHRREPVPSVVDCLVGTRVQAHCGTRPACLASAAIAGANLSERRPEPTNLWAHA
ncbi:hypothetical protein [Streptomyces sp. YGL11-2]|uniref:hypothetical protein n=1 Tax=Streptomyces sp. YGL11-2 TaxID=3414028 RepID=UPI003CEA5466